MLERQLRYSWKLFDTPHAQAGKMTVAPGFIDFHGQCYCPLKKHIIHRGKLPTISTLMDNTTQLSIDYSDASMSTTATINSPTTKLLRTPYRNKSFPMYSIAASHYLELAQIENFSRYFVASSTPSSIFSGCVPLPVAVGCFPPALPPTTPTTVFAQSPGETPWLRYCYIYVSKCSSSRS